MLLVIDFDFVGRNHDLRRHVAALQGGNDELIAHALAEFLQADAFGLQCPDQPRAGAVILADAFAHRFFDDTVRQVVAGSLEIVKDQLTVHQLFQVFLAGLCHRLLELLAIIAVLLLQSRKDLQGQVPHILECND